MNTFAAYIFANGEFREPELLVRVWNKTQNDNKTVEDVREAEEFNTRVYKLSEQF